MHAAARREGCPGTRGFTLVELLVVLLILGLAAGVVLPTLGTRAPTGVGAVTRELTALHAAARAAAVARGTRVSVVVEPESGAYALILEADPALPLDTLRTGALPYGPGLRLVGEEGGWAVTVFDALGRARGGRIRLLHDGGEDALQIDPWTGALAVERR